ncbi:MAG: YbjN domain-containing protein [Veillonellaceae bacterium]|nr:YbjN domain-containing protein [Veillonellaceae bacterium]
MANEENIVEISVAQRKDKALQDYLDSNKVSGFGKQYAGENGEVIIYRSNLQIQEDAIPFMILLDNSVYTLLQFQVASGLVKEDKKEKLAAYFNDLNNQYRMLKFTCDAAGNVLLSVSVPAGTQHFEPALVIAILNEVERLLNEEYDALMAKLKE